MTLESIEKLRKLGHSIVCTGQMERAIDELADAIEREVDERYMLLPVDVDGVPWKLTDEYLVDECGNECVFTGMRVTSHGRWELATNCTWHLASDCRHVKPDPVRELLIKFFTEIVYSDEENAYLDDFGKHLDEFAERIREAVGE